MQAAVAVRSDAVGGRRWAPPCVASLAVVVGWVALQPTAGRFVNADTSAYLSLARQWLEGDVDAAVSGYWGPLLSWLCAPLLAVGVPDLLAVRLVVLGGALATVWAADGWTRRLGTDPAARVWVLAALVPYLVWQATHGVYPETVTNALLLGGGALLVAGPARRSRPVVAGSMLGAAYLAKAVGLPLGVGLLAVVVAGQVVAATRAERGAVLRRGAVALAALTVVAGAWVTVLSVRAGTPTWSTAAEFNAGLVGSRGNPLLRAGLYDLPFAGARSPWDEPTSLRAAAEVQVRSGEGAGTGAAVVGNLRVTAGAVARRAAVPAVLGLVGLGVVLARRRRAPRAAVAAVALAALAAGDVAGYVLVIVIERYLWLPMVVAVLLAGPAVGIASRRGRAAPVGALLLLGTTAGAVSAVAPRAGDHAEVVAVAEAAPEDLLAGADVAAVGDWSRTLALCVRLDCAFRGSTGPDPDSELPLLRAEGIDAVVRWQDAPAPDGDGTVDDGRVVVLWLTADGLEPVLEVPLPDDG